MKKEDVKIGGEYRVNNTFSNYCGCDVIIRRHMSGNCFVAYMGDGEELAFGCNEFDNLEGEELCKLRREVEKLERELSSQKQNQQKMIDWTNQLEERIMDSEGAVKDLGASLEEHVNPQFLCCGDLVELMSDGITVKRAKFYSDVIGPVVGICNLGLLKIASVKLVNGNIDNYRY